VVLFCVTAVAVSSAGISTANDITLMKGILSRNLFPFSLLLTDPVDFPNLSEGELPDVAPPVLTEDTQAKLGSIITRKTGENLRITCQALGKPEPEVYWYRTRPGQSTSSGLPGGGGGPGGHATLVIENLVESDSGIFTCVARNVVGQTSANFTLHVEDMGQHPVLPAGPDNTTIIQV